MDDLYVTLAILLGEKVDEKFEDSDRAYHMEQFKKLKSEIEMEDILLHDDRRVVISGIAGIRKSTLSNKVISEWSKGKLFNGKGKSPHVTLLIPIRCRKLNDMTVTSETEIIDVIHKLNPKLKNLNKEAFEEIRKSTVVLVDGIDELISIDSISSDEKRRPCQTFVRNS